MLYKTTTGDRIDRGSRMWVNITPIGSVKRIDIKDIKFKGEGLLNYSINDVDHRYDEMREEEGYAPSPPVTVKTVAIEGGEALKLLEYALKDIDRFEKEEENLFILFLAKRLGSEFPPREILPVIIQKQKQMNLIAKVYGLCDSLLILTGASLFLLGIRKGVRKVRQKQIL